MPDLWLSAVFCQTKKKSLYPTNERFPQKNEQLAHGRSHRSFLVSDLSDLLTSLTKNEEMSESLIFKRSSKQLQNSCKEYSRGRIYARSTKQLHNSCKEYECKTVSELMQGAQQRQNSCKDNTSCRIFRNENIAQ